MAIEPEQVAALRKTLAPSAVKVSIEMDYPLDVSEKFISNLLTFIQSNYSALASKPYAFLLDTDVASTCQQIDLRAIAQNIASGKNLFKVNLDLRIGVCETIKDKTALSQLSLSKTSYAVYVSGADVTQFLKGTMLGEQDIRYPDAAPARCAVHSHPMDKFELIVDEHFCECISNEKRVKYWHNKKDRILKSNGKDGTEMLFHHDLFWWLNHCISDSIRVYGEVAMTGLDKTDVVVVNEHGPHVIEIKWLGKNDKKTTYDKTQIENGIKQVGLYLKRDNEYVRGYLVIYDGRSWVKHSSESGYSPDLLHVRCANPIIKFLESETPSVQSKHP